MTTVDAQSAHTGASPADAVPDAAGPGTPASWQAYLARLEGLAAELAGHGMRTQLVTPPGRLPSLRVVNPAAAALAEDVYAGPGRDGQWFFWWSWAERIAADEDVPAAATRIRRVLAARD